MNEKTIEALAEYFCGPAVAHNSICLSLPTDNIHHKMARRFFACRDALGIRHYEGKDEAVKYIKHALEGEEAS